MHDFFVCIIFSFLFCTAIYALGRLILQFVFAPKKEPRIYIGKCSKNDLEFRVRAALLSYPDSEIYVALPKKDAEAEFIFNKLKEKHPAIQRI